MRGWPPARSGLLEVGLTPDPLAQIRRDAADVLLRAAGVPAAGEPAPDASPRVARVVLPAAVHVVEPCLVSVEA